MPIELTVGRRQQHDPTFPHIFNELIPKLKIAFLNLYFEIVNRATDTESKSKFL